ncbi:MAG: hypothetical protein ACJA2N_001568 [Salibacteraceae bacterium]|jgi:hypothetical protein
MMLAGSEGIWVYAAIGIASLLYKAWKKNQANTNETESPKQNDSGKTSFGFEELIQKFEQKYKAQTDYGKEMQPEEVEVQNKEPISANFNTSLNSKKPAITEPIKAVQPKVEVKKDYSGSKDRNFQIEVSEDRPDLDLKQMIIANTILERPTY